MPIKDLFEIQIGKESTWGTGVAGTAKLMGVTDARLLPKVTTKLFKQLRGSLQPAYETALAAQGGGAYVEGIVTYEDIGYWIESMVGEDTPSGVGPYTYDYVAPIASQITPRILTFYKTQTPDVYRLLGGLVNQLVIRGATGDNDTELTFRADLVGKAVDENGSEASLSDRSVIPAMAHHISVFLDTWGGTMGATALSPTGIAFELTLNANWRLKRGLGNLAPVGYIGRAWPPESNSLKLTLEFDSTVNSYLDSILAASAVWQRQIRIKATSGTNVVQLDFAGTQQEAPEVFVDDDGLITMDLMLHGTYNSTFGNFFKAQIVNGVSALP